MNTPSLAPITTAVVCAGRRHELRWAEGSLTAPHHPSADRERALIALGADPAPCLQILDAWTRHADDLDVLVLAARGPSDPFPGADHNTAPYLVPPVPARMGFPGGGARASMMVAQAGWVGYAPQSAMHRRRYLDPADDGADDLDMVFGLGPAVVQRLTATVIATWTDRIADNDGRVADALPMLDAAVYGRMASALLPWLGEAKALELTLQRPDGEPTIRRTGRTVSVAVPFAWLRDVWVHGLSVLLDRFCLRAEHSGGTWTLETVTRALDEVRPVTISS